MMPSGMVPLVFLFRTDLLISLALLLGAVVCLTIRAKSVPMFCFVNSPPTCELRLSVNVIVALPIEDRRVLGPSCIVEGLVCFASFTSFRSFGDVLSTSARTLDKIRTNSDVVSG